MRTARNVARAGTDVARAGIETADLRMASECTIPRRMRMQQKMLHVQEINLHAKQPRTPQKLHRRTPQGLLPPHLLHPH